MDETTEVEDGGCVRLCYVIVGGLGMFCFLFVLHLDCKMWTQRVAEWLVRYTPFFVHVHAYACVHV